MQSFGLHFFDIKNTFSYFCAFNTKNNKKLLLLMIKVTQTYESPICDFIDVKTEGVLCASMEQLYEYDGEFEW